MWLWFWLWLLLLTNSFEHGDLSWALFHLLLERPLHEGNRSETDHQGPVSRVFNLQPIKTQYLAGLRWPDHPEAPKFSKPKIPEPPSPKVFAVLGLETIASNQEMRVPVAECGC